VFMFVVSISFFLNDAWLSVSPKSFKSASEVATLRPAERENVIFQSKILKIWNVKCGSDVPNAAKRTNARHR
jgi:hypothetical protein